MKIIMDIMKLKCLECSNITYREYNSGLISSDCMKCGASLKVKPTGEESTTEFDSF